MDFQKRMLPTSKDYIFQEEGYYIWGGTMFRYQDSYYMIYSRWKQELGFLAWATDSQLCLAKTDSLHGKFEHVKVLFHYTDPETNKKICMHNPTVITWHGKIYLYYMINKGTGDWWQHRNNQRIGVAYCEDPEGEWILPSQPVIDISTEGIDSLMVSNPTAVVTKDDHILMVYKAVSKYGTLPKGGKVLCAVAQAKHPCGPFIKYGNPIMENPEDRRCVEDPYIWSEGGKYYALVKDFNGYFTKTNHRAVATFVSENGIDWECSENPLAFMPQINYGDEIVPVHYLERPQIYIENGKCVFLLCACMEQENAKTTFNIRIPLAHIE